MISKAFYNLIETWKKIVDVQKISEFYVKELLPSIVESYPQKHKLSTLMKPDGLILTVGTSIEPLCFSIRLLKPKKVFFLHTKKTLEHTSQIIEFLSLTPPMFERYEIKEREPEKFYEQIRIINQSLSHKAKIIIDMTGGQKTMAAMATMAAFAIKCTAIYIRSNRDHILQRQEPRSERCEVIVNPYLLLGDEQIPAIVSFFNSRDYFAAEKLCTNVAESILNSKKFELLANLAIGLRCVNNLELKKGYKIIHSFINKAQKFNILSEVTLQLQKLDELLSFLGNTNQEKEIFSDIIKHHKTPKLLKASMQSSFSILFIIFKLGEAELEINKNYDTACLLFYRTIELTQQIAFASSFQTTTKQFNYSAFCKELQISDDELENKIIEVYQSEEIFGKIANFKRQDDVSLFTGTVLLYISKTWELYKDISKVNDVKQASNIRNQSKFAHGMATISKDEARDLYQLAKRIVMRFPSEYVPNEKDFAQKLLLQPEFRANMLL